MGVVNLKTNKIEPSADPVQFIVGKRWATWFSNGKRVLSDTKDTESALSSDINVTGNPARDNLEMVLSEKLSINPVLSIHDMTGKEILSQNLSSSKNVSIRVSDLIAGMYTVTVTSGTFHASIKFVKQ